MDIHRLIASDLAPVLKTGSRRWTRGKGTSCGRGGKYKDA